MEAINKNKEEIMTSKRNLHWISYGVIGKVENYLNFELLKGGIENGLHCKN